MKGFFKEIKGSESDEELVMKTARNIEARARFLPNGQKAPEIFHKVEANKGLFSKRELDAFHDWRDIRNKYIHAQILNVTDRAAFIANYKYFYAALENVTRQYANTGINFSWATLGQFFKAIIADLFSFDGQRTIAAIVRLVLVFFCIWLLFTFALPFVQMSLAILLLPAAFYFKKYKAWILLASLAACIYTMATWEKEWYRFEMLVYFPVLASTFFGFFVANIITGIAVVGILVGPYVTKKVRP